MNSDQGPSKCCDFIYDLATLLKEEALAAKKAKQETQSDFDTGYLFAMMSVISLLKSQARAFDAEEYVPQLKDIDPENDLA